MAWDRSVRLLANLFSWNVIRGSQQENFNSENFIEIPKFIEISLHLGLFHFKSRIDNISITHFPINDAIVFDQVARTIVFEKTKVGMWHRRVRIRLKYTETINKSLFDVSC